MLTPEQQADYDYAMSLLEKKEVGKLAFVINADVKLFEKSMQQVAESMSKFKISEAMLKACKSQAVSAFHTGRYDQIIAAQKAALDKKILDALGIPNSIFQGATSAQDSK